VPERKVWFGSGLGAWNGADVASAAESVRLVGQADREGLDLFTVAGLDPAEAPAPPIWTGSVGPKSLAVTGRLADGWVPPRASDWRSTLYRESRPRIDEAAVEAGRDPAQIATICNFGGRITAEPLAASRGEDGRWIGGSARQWIDELTDAVLEHHASGFVYRSTDDAPADAALARWAGEIVPAVREAIKAQLPGRGFGCRSRTEATGTASRWPPACAGPPARWSPLAGSGRRLANKVGG